MLSSLKWSMGCCTKTVTGGGGSTPRRTRCDVCLMDQIETQPNNPNRPGKTTSKDVIQQGATLPAQGDESSNVGPDSPLQTPHARSQQRHEQKAGQVHLAVSKDPLTYGLLVRPFLSDAKRCQTGELRRNQRLTKAGLTGIQSQHSGFFLRSLHP